MWYTPNDMKKIKNKLKLNPNSFLVKNKNSVSVVILVVLLFSVFYYYKGLFISATVNGKPITRIQVIKDLEKRSGDQALDSLITRSLINQEAAKKGIKVTNQDLDAEISKISDSLKSQGQDLEQVMATQGLTQQDVRDQLDLQLKIEKLLGDKLNVTEAEIDDFIKTNDSYFSAEQKVAADFRSTIVDQVKSQKISQLGQPYVEELRKNAHVKYLNK